MSWKLWSIAVLAAAFTLFPGTTDAQARHRRSHHGSHECCQYIKCGHSRHGHHGWQQSRNYGSLQPAGCGHASCGCQQTASYGWQQTGFVATDTCCSPQPAVCNVQPLSATSVIAENFPASQPRREQAPTSDASLVQ